MHTVARKRTRSKDKSPEITRLMKFMDHMGVKSIDIQHKTDISWRTIDNYIHNNLPIGVQLLRQLHLKYSVSIDWLLSGTGNMFINTHNQVNDEKKTVYQVKNARTLRMTNFINDFMQDAHEDDQTWLEMQIKFNVPQYAKYLSTVDKLHA